MVQLAVSHLDGVVREALELQHQQRRQRLEADALERTNAPLAPLAPPGIVATLERLPPHEALKRLPHRAHVGDAELNVPERLGAHALVAAPAAAHRRAQPPFEELHDRRCATRHARRARTLERLEEHAAQLLDIVLPEAVGLTPPERCGELAGGEGDSLRVLQPREELTQLQRHARCRRAVQLLVVAKRKHRTPDFGRDKQRLQQRIEVAGCAFVGQPRPPLRCWPCHVPICRPAVAPRCQARLCERGPRFERMRYLGLKVGEVRHQASKLVGGGVARHSYRTKRRPHTHPSRRKPMP